MRPFVYHSPTKTEEALALARVPASSHVTASVQLMGGGTTLLDLMKLDVMRPTDIVSISNLDNVDMNRITRSTDGLHIGALVTMAQMADDPDLRRDYPVLTDSLWLAASQQLRNMARLGGNVLQRTRCSYFRDTSYSQCNKRVPGSGCAALDGVNKGHAVLGVSEHCIAMYPSDWAQGLVALDAEVIVQSTKGTRTLSFAKLHRLPGDTPHIETNLRPGELITGFLVPGGPWPRSLYRKIRDRESYQFANASAAVAMNLDGPRIREVRIGLGGVATIPWRAHKAEALLTGKELTEELAVTAASAEFERAHPRKFNAYKIPLGKATMVRALLEAHAMEV